MPGGAQARIQVLEEVLALTRAFAAGVAGVDAAGVAAFVQERERLMARLAELAAGFGQDEPVAMARQRGAIEQLLALDRDLAAQAATVGGELGTSLAVLSRGRQALDGYGAAGGAPAVFVDKDA